jgi:hypothetical protein
MSDRERRGTNRPLWLDVHPFVGRAALGLIVWTVVAVWALFSHSYYGPLLWSVVTFLVAIFLAVSLILLRLERKNDDARRATTFRDWSHGDLDTGSGPGDARTAAVMILLIPTAIAVGMTAFGLIEFLSAEGMLSLSAS